MLSNTEKQDKLYAAYQVRKKGKGHPQPLWWEGNNNKGGAKRTVEGGLGEYQADRLFNAQGHEKLNHGGQLVDLEEPPKGKGLDGVWKNAAPPPMYLITETKFTTTPDKVVALSSGGQLSDPWILAGNRLENALGRVEGGRMRKAMRNSDMVGRRLLHVDSDGYLHEYEVDDKGKFDLSKPLKKLKV